MKIQPLLLFVLICIHTTFLAGSETPSEAAKEIAATAIQWLAFDEWGRTQSDSPHPGDAEPAVKLFRERVQKHPNTQMPIMVFGEGMSAFSATYDLTERALHIEEALSPGKVIPHRLKVRVDFVAADRWLVSFIMGQAILKIEVTHEGSGYHVAGFKGTEILD